MRDYVLFVIGVFNVIILCFVEVCGILVIWLDEVCLDEGDYLEMFLIEFFLKGG